MPTIRTIVLTTPLAPGDIEAEEMTFSNPIFMGAGDDTHDQVERLNMRVEDALNLLGGLQQPGPISAQDRASLEMNLCTIVADIAMALGVEASEMKIVR
jgi:hypothetical protein